MASTLIQAVLVVFNLLIVIQGSIFHPPNKNRCVPIDIPLCKDIQYNYTFFPNTILEQDQQILQTQTEHFKPLINTKCNPNIKFFVCSVFAPMCPESMPQPVTSCRSVCEEVDPTTINVAPRVKKDCVHILEEFGISWPEVLNCSRFPQSPELCMMKPAVDHHGAHHVPPEQESQQPPDGFSGLLDLYPPAVPQCPAQMVNLDPLDARGACAVGCKAHFMFGADHKALAHFWMLVWAALSLIITAFTVLTFLCDRQRFPFPERSIIYLSACYHVYSWAWMARALLSFDELACERLPNGESFLASGTLDNTRCVVSFVLLYYFSMAGSLWWLMLTFTWYLSAGRKWVPEGIDACSSYLHLCAWGIPALQTVAVLVAHKVDANELTGLCGVGNADPLALATFVVAPRTVFVVVGTGFILAGFFSMCQERDAFRRRGTDTKKLEKFMVKMGLFSALYIVPAITLIAADVYHITILQQWFPVTYGCKAFGGATRCRTPDQKPKVEYYLVHILMSLIVGSAAGMWVVSRKTFQMWQRVLCCGLCSPAPAKRPPPQQHRPTANYASRPLLPAGFPPPPTPPTPPQWMMLPTIAHSQQSSRQAWQQSNVV